MVSIWRGQRLWMRIPISPWCVRGYWRKPRHMHPPRPLQSDGRQVTATAGGRRRVSSTRAYGAGWNAHDALEGAAEGRLRFIAQALRGDRDAHAFVLDPPSCLEHLYLGDVTRRTFAHDAGEGFGESGARCTHEPGEGRHVPVALGFGMDGCDH